MYQLEYHSVHHRPALAGRAAANAGETIVKFGYFSQLQMPKPWKSENAEYELFWNSMQEAIHAEEVGFDYYWETEHHFYREIGHSSSPEVFLAALAQHTKRIRLGFGVVVLPCNHPFRVAEYVSTLDILSNGRVELGTGRGASVYHIEAFGVSPDDSKEIWEESLRVLCSLFLNDKFPGHKGKWYDLPARHLTPKPLQRPHPPLWVAATQPTTFAAAARMGLGAIGFTAMPPEDLIPAVQSYRAAQGECVPVGGYANHQVAGFSICSVDTDDRRGIEQACANARWYLGDNDAELQKYRFGTLKGGQDNAYYEAAEKAQKDRVGVIRSRTNDELIEQGMVIGGNPDRVCRSIEKWQKVGFDQILLMIQAGHATHDDVMRSLDLLGSKVLPHFGESVHLQPEPQPIGAAG